MRYLTGGKGHFNTFAAFRNISAFLLIDSYKELKSKYHTVKQEAVKYFRDILRAAKDKGKKSCIVYMHSRN